MAADDLKFRLATSDDAAQIQQLVQAAFRAEDSRPNWTADMKLGSSFSVHVEEVAAQIAKTNGGILIATDNDGLVASVEVFKRSAELARLSMVAVDQRRQRGGVGRQVLAYAEDYCQRTWGVKKIGLDALSTREELILWYTRRGYFKTGELAPFPYERHAGEDIEEGLHFVEMEKDLSAGPVAAGPV